MRVPVPVAFEDPMLVAIIAVVVVFAPALLGLVVALVNNRKADRATRSYVKPMLAGLGSGLLVALVLGSLAYAAVPYFKQKEAFNQVAEYYDTNIDVEGRRLPVMLYPQADVESPIPVDVYRVAGGNAENCWVYLQSTGPNDSLEYALYCGDPLVEFSN